MINQLSGVDRTFYILLYQLNLVPMIADGYEADDSTQRSTSQFFMADTPS